VVLDHDDLRPGGSANTALAWAGLPALHRRGGGRRRLFGRWLASALAQVERLDGAACATTLSIGLTATRMASAPSSPCAAICPAMGWDLLPRSEGFADGLLLLCGSFLTDRLAADYPAIFAWAAERRIDLALDSAGRQGWTDAQRNAKGWLAPPRHLLINEAGPG
jgi:hypothetical protein